MKNSTTDIKSNRCRVLADMIDRRHREISDARGVARAASNTLVRARGEVSRLQSRINRLLSCWLAISDTDAASRADAQQTLV